VKIVGHAEHIFAHVVIRTVVVTAPAIRAKTDIDRMRPGDEKIGADSDVHTQPGNGIEISQVIDIFGILDIAKGADGTWAAGDYVEIPTGSGSTGDRNGLATPILADLDGNGTVDRVYAGDLKGQMWTFDLSSTSSGSWNIPNSEPLFTTKNNLPITAQPTLAKHPTLANSGSNAPNLMVYFGSGQYLVDADKTSTNDNYFYGVWDRGDTDLSDGDLKEQGYDSNFTQRVLKNDPVDYAGGDYGWFVELLDQGERSVTHPVVRADVVFFNTFVSVSDPCSVGGYGYRFAVNLVNGGSPLAPVSDTNNDGVIDDLDLADDGSGGTGVIAAVRQDGYLPEPVFLEDIAFTAETPTKVKKIKKLPDGRFSWQELLK
jgi:type IV pilus assembly protein PilY1